MQVVGCLTLYFPLKITSVSTLLQGPLSCSVTIQEHEAFPTNLLAFGRRIIINLLSLKKKCIEVLRIFLKFFPSTENVICLFYSGSSYFPPRKFFSDHNFLVQPILRNST